MARSIHEIIEGINSLVADDFNLWNEDAYGMERLYELTDDLKEMPDRSLALRSMFDLIERFPDPDAHTSLGTPGPLVHAIESIEGYEDELLQSLDRRPTTYTVLMINRILNISVSEDQRKKFMSLLLDTTHHPKASEDTIRDALSFYNFQQDKESA